MCINICLIVVYRDRNSKCFSSRPPSISINVHVFICLDMPPNYIVNSLSFGTSRQIYSHGMWVEVKCPVDVVRNNTLFLLIYQADMKEPLKKAQGYPGRLLPKWLQGAENFLWTLSTENMINLDAENLLPWLLYIGTKSRRLCLLFTCQKTNVITISNWSLSSRNIILW